MKGENSEAVEIKLNMIEKFIKTYVSQYQTVYVSIKQSIEFLTISASLLKAEFPECAE